MDNVTWPACTSDIMWSVQETAQMARKTEVACKRAIIFPTGALLVKGIGSELINE
jgi:hypothetical protein